MFVQAALCQVVSPHLTSQTLNWCLTKMKPHSTNPNDAHVPRAWCDTRPGSSSWERRVAWVMSVGRVAMRWPSHGAAHVSFVTPYRPSVTQNMAANCQLLRGRETAPAISVLPHIRLCFSQGRVWSCQL